MNIELKAFLQNALGVLAASLTTTIALAISQSHIDAQSLATLLMLLSTFSWVFIVVVACASVLSLVKTRSWKDFFIIPFVCLLFSSGTIHLIYWIVGHAPFFEFTNDSDVFALSVFVKLEHALFGWSFAVPLWQYVVRRDSAILPAILCALVSTWYLLCFFILP